MKIGIFDSGIGGLSVLKVINQIQCGLDIIYVADTNRMPYGEKKLEDIKQYSIEIANFLTSKNVDCIIIACNTASASAYEYLKNNMNIPIYSIIEAGVDSISDKDNILVLATLATVNSHKYRDKILEKYNKNVIEIACPKFASLIEEQNLEDIDDIIRQYIQDTKFDNILLGCTHYPFISNNLSKIYNKEIIDPAHKILDYLKLPKINDINKIQFYVTGSVPKFKLTAEKILNMKIENIDHLKL